MCMFVSMVCFEPLESIQNQKVMEFPTNAQAFPYWGQGREVVTAEKAVTGR